MPGENLTREEAAARSAVVRAPRYEVALDLTEGDLLFRATTTVRFAGEPGGATFVDLVADRVLALRLNGADLDAGAWDGARIALDALTGDDELTVVALMRYSRTGEGLHRFVDPADGAVYCFTQMAVPDARRVFAVFDQPDLKGRFTVRVTAPDDWTVLANEPGIAEPVGDGDALWRFEETPPISSYLVAVAAGPWVAHEDALTSTDGRRIPLRILGRGSLAAHLDGASMVATARAGFAFYEGAFGIPFPFSKYDQVFVPEYNWGAMENPGAVTFNEAFVFRSAPTDAQRERRDSVVLHELAHMWFGDLVTMRWWDDLWLNESFATFMSGLALAEATPWTGAWSTFALTEKTRGIEQDQLPSTHPVVAVIRDLDDVGVNFDGITYAKGASVLKQLAAWVGRDAFLAGVGAYLRRHAWGSATLADLLAELEAASGRDLAGWSDRWLETSGVSRLSIDSDGSVRQAGVPLRPHRIAIGGYDRVDGRLVRTWREEVDVEGERTAVPALRGRLRPALLLPNDDDLTYAKVRLDADSLRTAWASVSAIADPLARTLVWGDLWDLVRDGEGRPRDFVRPVAEQGVTEPLSPLRGALLRQATLAAELYVAADARAETLALLGDAILAALRAAPPSSDAQLQLAAAFARVAGTRAQLRALVGLEAGDLPGLPLDPDLRWSLLTARVAGGTAGEADIAALLASDRTARGYEAGALATAAVPTPAAKAAAWTAATSGDLPNEQVRSVLAGFGRVTDAALLEPFVARYSEEIGGLWSAHPGAVGRDLVTGLYPLAFVDPRLAATAAGWLDDHADAPAPLRRLVAEQLDRTRRALAARAADGRG